MTDLTSDFFRHMAIALPAKLDRLDDQAREVKRVYVLTAIYVATPGEPEVRDLAYEYVLQDGLLDCKPEMIRWDLPSLISQAREVLRDKCEAELRRLHG